MTPVAIGAQEHLAPLADGRGSASYSTPGFSFDVFQGAIMSIIQDRRTLLTGAAAATLFTPGLAFAQSGDVTPMRAAAEKGFDASVKRIQDWIALPSIAAENRDMEKGCEYMMALAKDAGFQHVERVPTDGFPGVFATLDVGAKRTIGIYFMYDVKQFDPAEWSSPPLEARVVDKPGFGKVIVGRGAVNQKGPEATFLAALHAIRAAGKKPPVNIVLVCEGEEEIGSPNFRQIVTQPKVLAALKKCEGVVIPAGWQSPSNGGVSVNLGAKGVVEFELVASGAKWGKGPKTDIHSSEKARVDSPAWRLVSALATLVTPDGNTPAVDGYFEKVRPLTAREKELLAMAARQMSEADAKKAMGVDRWIDDLPWDKALERLASQPTINIEGLVSGYTGPGGKTILPGRAVAKIDTRLVPNQTKDDAVAKIRAHLDKRGFTDIELNVTGGYDPTETDENSRLIKAEIATYKKAGVPISVYPRLAGSWPGAVFTSAPVSLPAGQFGLGHGSGAHAPNEYYVIESTNPKVEGLVGATVGYIDFLYEIAAIK
jgi:acetylornithine deacetylase/succinyl-diaminopimelate desuccinylase-like protein